MMVMTLTMLTTLRTATFNDDENDTGDENITIDEIEMKNIFLQYN